MNNNTINQLTSYARQIAVYRGYSELVNGLQPVNVLNEKLEHEQQEFQEAVASGDLLHILHEAADLLYYSACLFVQERRADDHYAACLASVEAQLERMGYQLTDEQIERAALAKYAFRASAPNMKNEREEILLIIDAIS